MADLSKIKHLLDLQDTSFNMTAPENLMVPEEEITPEDDPMAFAPAVEEDQEEVTPSRNAPLASAEDISKIQAIPLPPAQASIKPESKTTTPETPKELPQETMLKELQKARAEQNQALTLLQGGNQIAQAFAAGSGAKIGDGSDVIKSLRDQANQPIADYKERIEDEENDPNSDVSKFMRENAYSVLKKLNPEKTYDLEKMTANQLKKAFGGKLLGSTLSPPMEWVATDRVTADGTPVKFNKRTGEFMAGTRIIQPGEVTPRDIARKDSLTGNYGLAGPGGQLIVKPTDYSGIEKNLKNTETTNSGETKAKNVPFAEFMKAAPDVSDKVTKLKEQFIKDMANSREVAQATTNLASKLKPGANGEVDSGLLGGIQTQAAKMAGQKGVLTDQDLVKFAGAGGVPAKINRIIDGTLFGDMSDDDIKFFKRFGQLMDKSLDKIIENDSKYYVDQVRQMGEVAIPGFTDGNAREWLAVDKVAPAVQGKNKGTEQDPVVKVKGPSGQIAEMLKSKAEKYLKKAGYELVK